MKQSKIKRMAWTMILSLCLVVGFSIQAMTAPKVTLKLFTTDALYAHSLSTTVAQQYEKETGVRVVVEMFPYDESHEKTMFELAAGSPSYDLLIADSIWSGEVMQSGRVYRLEEFFTKPGFPQLELENLCMSTSTNYNTYEGKLYGIPVAENTGTLIYRTDLFSKYGLSGPPKTWAEFEEYAKKLTFDTNGDGAADVFGTVLLEVEQDAGYSQWTQRLVGFRAIEDKKYVFNNKNEPIFNHPTGIKALELVSDVLPYCPPGTMGYGHGEAIMGYKQGKIAMFAEWQDALFGFEDPTQSKVAGNIGYTILPYVEKDRPYGAVVSSWTLFINRASKHPDEAYKFLAWMTKGEAYELMGRGSAAGIAWVPLRDDPELLKEKPFLQAWGEYRDAGLDLKQIPTQYREFTEVQRIIWEETTQYLTKGKTAKGAIADAWERVYTLMKEAGHF